MYTFFFFGFRFGSVIASVLGALFFHDFKSQVCKVAIVFVSEVHYACCEFFISLHA